MQSTKILELLAPAKNLECGIAAIHHGADAVYIGAPKFGAREAAGNSIEEIEKLATEARLFGVKTYVALNTILYDNELVEAERIIRQVYEAGADALIIQDFGILEMDLPPIALHASTQANNFTVDKIKFLEAVGFKRAVLARELSLLQIEEISAQTTIELEAFVHGSLCVSLSGQCFMSHAMGGRSANRGACAQPCRKKYTLSDATGKTIIRDKHLLSLKDLNRSQTIAELVAAGVHSFKIEGRLKDIDYVKNITAFYRLELDRFLEGKPEFAPSSSGTTRIFFTPDPAKTFHKGATEYFIYGRQDSVAGIDSPKSTGEEIGEVVRVNRDSFQLSGCIMPGNNDGLTFVNRKGESDGLKVNRVENGSIFPDRMNNIFVGARIYRNWDHSFQMALGKKTSGRKIPIDIKLESTLDGFTVGTSLMVARNAFDGNFDVNQDGATTRVTPTMNSVVMDKVPANDPTKSRENILRQLSKSGDTPFMVRDIDTGGNEQYFFTSQQLNALRRGLLDQLAAKLSAKKPAQPAKMEPSVKQENRNQDLTIPYPIDSFHSENNISNRLALQFYRRHGLELPETAVEKRAVIGRLQVMITKHCIQHELGFCKRFGGTFPNEFALPFSLKDGANSFDLEFDCKICMMRIFTEM
ncbi:MAG: U32 family peptidase [Prolixibacteraceae bacterium]|nr:U32 family peptidase [Prolixibacteraceae bacterium]